MNTDTFKKAGIHFTHCRNAGVPEIPYVQDVLYALRLSRDEHAYTFSVSNHSTYVVNVCLAAAAVGHDVLNMDRYDEAEARKIIAQTILDLCAPNDRCLFNPSVAEATIALGGKVPESRESRLLACSCASCKKRSRDEGLSGLEAAASG